MKKSFRNTFRTDGKTISYRKRMRGINSCSYEARYRRNGYNISVSAKSILELKKKFIEALNATDQEEQENKVPTTFNEFTMYYFENFRKRKVGTQTYRVDLNRYKIHILPHFGSIELKKIIPTQCQQLIDKITQRGYKRTAQEVYSLLNLIFKMAMAHDLISKNPLAIVQSIEHEREHGKALTREEEKYLLTVTNKTPYQLMFAVALYTGLRPNEFNSARIEGDFIIAINSKRKKKKVEYKKIPITPMLKPYLNGVDELNFYTPYTLREKFRLILPKHKLYDLRTTFYTRCQECGIAEVALNEFVGHSLGVLGNTYTDLSDEVLLKEGKKFNY